MDKSIHVSVLLQPSIEFLKIIAGNTYIDLTLGGGGHSREIIKKLQGRGKLVAFDLDQTAIKRFEEFLRSEGFESKEGYFMKDDLEVILLNENFNRLSEVLRDRNISEVHGIVADLGFSSDQLEQGKGFSFKHDEELDMRMSDKLQVKAKDLLNALNEKQLEEIFRKHGDEPAARRIAREIVQVRKHRPIETTKDLLEIIEGLNIRGSFSRTLRNLLPATRVFQALRITVNQEIDSLTHLLPQMLEVAVAGSRLVIISFHSGEDRIVKRFFMENEKKGLLKILTKKPYEPSDEEIYINRRSRSAKMRAAEVI